MFYQFFLFFQQIGTHPKTEDNATLILYGLKEKSNTNFDQIQFEEVKAILEIRMIIILGYGENVDN